MSTTTLAWNTSPAAGTTHSDPSLLSTTTSTSSDADMELIPEADNERDASTLAALASDLFGGYSGGGCWQIPAHHGLALQLHPQDGTVTLHAVPDQHYPDIHPRCYAPAGLQNLRLLHGGGSGTAVFGGYDSVAQQHIVMKHGGATDTREVMALATIADQLLVRQQRQDDSHQQQQDAVTAAARRMKERIPEFLFVYISRHHVRDRNRELWSILRKITYTGSGRRLSVIASMRMIKNKNHDNAGTTTARRTLSHNDLSQMGEQQQELQQENDDGRYPSQSVVEEDPPAHEEHAEEDLHHLLMHEDPHDERELRVQTGCQVREAQIHVRNRGPVEVWIPQHCDCDLEHDYRMVAGVSFLQEFKTALMKQQDQHNWKVTLAQKWIGGPNGDNGADVLTSGRLFGNLLDTLIREFTSIMQDLDTLTLPEERHGALERVKDELVRLQELDDVRAVSKEADRFVGKAILKNFHPGHGRFRNLRMLGHDFRDGEFFLTSAERPPAEFLALLLQRGESMCDIFVNAPDSQSALDRMEDRGWLDILQHAVQLEGCPSATECIWTCGLTDAGLHNSFLSADRGLEVFDLGEPRSEPRPAFLTKVLMSFFHTLGMEHDGGSSWKTRFVVVEASDGTERLSLTQETELKIPYLHQVFHTVLEHFIQNIFNGNGSVRQLLIKYVVLQLLSDAAFCLKRWELKGGGARRYGECLKYRMEKWLWRSIWDQYIASYVHVNFLKE